MPVASKLGPFHTECGGQQRCNIRLWVDWGPLEGWGKCRATPQHKGTPHHGGAVVPRMYNPWELECNAISDAAQGYKDGEWECPCPRGWKVAGGDGLPAGSRCTGQLAKAKTQANDHQVGLHHHRLPPTYTTILPSNRPSPHPYNTWSVCIYPWNSPAPPSPQLRKAVCWQPGLYLLAG